MRLDSGLADRISHTGRIIAFRNRLIHGYSTVSDEVVWGVLEMHLDILRQEVKILLQEE